MKKIILVLCSSILPIIAFANTVSVQHYQPNNQRTAEQNRLMGQQATHWYNPPPQTTTVHKPRPPIRPPYHRPPQHNPSVQVYIAPEQEQSYQSTEEVYLPAGGVYRKTTQTVPMYRQGSVYRIETPQHKVIHQGHYYVEQDE